MIFVFRSVNYVRTMFTSVYETFLKLSTDVLVQEVPDVQFWKRGEKQRTLWTGEVWERRIVKRLFSSVALNSVPIVLEHRPL